jgi:hypothetical protein
MVRTDLKLPRKKARRQKFGLPRLCRPSRIKPEGQVPGRRLQSRTGHGRNGQRPPFRGARWAAGLSPRGFPRGIACRSSALRRPPYGLRETGNAPDNPPRPICQAPAAGNSVAGVGRPGPLWGGRLRPLRARVRRCPIPRRARNFCARVARRSRTADGASTSRIRQPAAALVRGRGVTRGASRPHDHPGRAW